MAACCRTHAASLLACHLSLLYAFPLPDMIAPSDHYAILLRESLLSGYSGECATFGSPMLAR